MPQLLVNLDNGRDCEKAVKILQRRIALGRRNGAGRAGAKARRDRDWAEHLLESGPDGGEKNSVHDLPLPQKLKQIQSRGMWKHLVKIANSAQDPLSLPELDGLLDLPKNKMRSLKAIMAKLENRFGLLFLKVDQEAGVDEAGNPRYVMVPKVRRQILRLAAE